MNSLNILKTLYHYTFGCCCGSGQLDTRDEERQLLLVEVALDALEYQASLNKRVLAHVSSAIDHEDSKSDDTDSKDTEIEYSEQGKTEQRNTEPEDTETEDSKTVDTKPEDKAEPEAQTLPIQDPVPHPELELKIDDPTRKIVNDIICPGKFNYEVEGKMIQERFAVSELESVKRGSFGTEVFRARAKANPQVKFAIKVIKKGSWRDWRSTATNDPWYDETENELKILLQVEHENIVRLLDYFWITRADVVLCHVLKIENLDFDLEDVLLKVDAPLPLQVTIIVAKQVGKALNFLHHERKIVNHDIKAQNVMMIPFKSLEPKEKLAEYLSSCVIKMIDFGLGKQYSGEVRDCKDSTALELRNGTRMYQSLEKLIKELYSPFSADCFAFAILLLETMMGYNEFQRQFDLEYYQIWDERDNLISTPFNFILKIAEKFFDDLEELTPMHQLVLDLLADEPKRWFMDQAMEKIDEL